MTPFVLVSGDFVTTGGMDRANYALASYLARQGGPVHLVAHRSDPDLASQPNVTVHRVPKPADSYTLASPLLACAGRFWARRLARQGARVLVNGGNCPFGDINWVHYVHAAFPPNGRSGLRHRWQHRFDAGCERRNLLRARLILANSRATRTVLLERFRLSPDRVHTVYYGCDSDQFRPADPAERLRIRNRLGWPIDRPLVVFVGGLGDHRKGFDTLFAAWQSLSAAGNGNADLVVIGAGADLSRWQARAAEAGLAGHIRFLGFRRDVPELLRACDVLAAPTRYEAYGLAVQEALACGLPTLVSAKAGIAERYPSDLHDLLLPDSEDAADLARRLRNCLDHLDDYRRRVAPFTEQLRARTWDDMAKDVVRLIESTDLKEPRP